MRQQRLPLLVAQQLAALQHILAVTFRIVLAAVYDGDLRRGSPSKQASRVSMQQCGAGSHPGGTPLKTPCW